MPKKKQTAGAKIRAAREAADVKQATMARAVDVTPTHLCSVERGRVEPSLTLIRRIAEVLGIEPGELV